MFSDTIINSSFGTHGETEKNIVENFGKEVLKKICINNDLKGEFFTELRNNNIEYSYDYYINSWFIAVSKKQKDKALEIIKSVIQTNGLQSKYLVKNKCIYTKDLVYAYPEEFGFKRSDLIKEDKNHDLSK